MNSEDLKLRTSEFAHHCVLVALLLPKNTLGLHIQKQLIRCSTSVAANYRAVCLSQSKKSFISKLSIVVEEADEAAFWIDFLVKENLLSEKEIENIRQEAKELTCIFVAARKTAKVKS